MEQNQKSCGNIFATKPAVTQPRTFRKLEDLNLIDNFLFQEMLTQKEDGEKFAKILLQTILGRPIRNVKIIPSIYDIEPNNTYERKTLPKRMRYYHGLIDTKLLSAGAGYDKLPNVFIIFILPYDPFDKNRMVYTVQNRCVEDNSILYDDGARKIFLYTKGCKGNPRQELKDMLKYIEKSTAENITNQDIASVSELVNKVKKRKEVGINYMKSWEMEQMVRDEGRKEGRDEMQEKLNQLTLLLSNAGRMEDIVKAAYDKEYQNALLKEFGL